MVFPHKLTEEEEMLVTKYSLLRKKRKALQQIKKGTKPAVPSPAQQPVKRSADTSQEEAREMAKRVMAAQALRQDNKGSGFKRSTNLERRLQNPDKAPAFHPFSQAPPPSNPSSSVEENTSSNPADEKKPQYKKNLYDNFVSGGLRSQQTLYDDDKRGRNLEKKRGNTVYVHGYGLDRELCEKAFLSYGKLANISVNTAKSCAIVTFESIEIAEKAIDEVNGNMFDNITLTVSMARRQPLLEAATDMNSPWTGLATGLTRGRHKDSRSVKQYDDDIF